MAQGTTIWDGFLPVQGDLIYAGPLYCLMFGFVGLGVMNAYKITHPMIKPYVYVAGTFCVVLQYVFLGIDIGKYDGFIFLDGLILPFKVLGNGSAYSSLSAVLMLVLPCIGIIGSSMWVIYSWIRYKPGD